MADRYFEYGIIHTDNDKDIEQGNFDFNDDVNCIRIAKREATTCIMLGVGLFSMINHSVWEGMLIFSSASLLWYEEMAQVLDKMFPIPDPDRDRDGDSDSNADGDRDDRDQLNVLITGTRLNIRYNYNSKVADLARALVHLPSPDLSDYSPHDYSDLGDLCTQYHIAKELDDCLEDCGYLAAREALTTIDPRLYLCVASSEHSEPYWDGQLLFIPVRIYDTAWIGMPTANTQIIEVLVPSEPITEYKTPPILPSMGGARLEPATFWSWMLRHE